MIYNYLKYVSKHINHNITIPSLRFVSNKHGRNASGHVPALMRDSDIFTQIFTTGGIGSGIGSPSPPRTLIISSFVSVNPAKMSLVSLEFRVFIIFLFFKY